MNILTIGNSYGDDSQRYLHQIARADGVALNAVNLFIGGCSLARHHRNMLSELPEYVLCCNGMSTGFKVSIKEALLNRDWDVVTLHQASHYSTDYGTYQPYLNNLAEYVRRLVPKAKLAINQTWAYEQDSSRLNDMMGYSDQADMFRDLAAAYRKAADEVSADIFIPSGEVFQALLASGIKKVHRDTYHAALGVGRYALGLTWYAMLTGKEVRDNTFADFDEEITPEQIETVKKCVTEVTRKYLK